MKVISVVGARPQFVKLSPIAKVLGATDGVNHVIVHTGQHYDAEMSDAFFEELEIPAPAVHLGVGSGSHGIQTGSMLASLDAVYEEHRPDWVLTYGDTNSTIAAALGAVKMHLAVAHLEAGLRSFNRRMPEEHNRVLSDHASDLLLVPTEEAMRNLGREGLADRSVLVGDVMADICLDVRDRAWDLEVPAEVAGGDYVVATIHRAENTDDPRRLGAVLAGLQAMPLPVLLVAHPRLVSRAMDSGLRLDDGAVRVCRPLSYVTMLGVVQRSAGVVTDSGGLQKEAYLLQVPCTTVRTETEWVETLVDGWNVLDPELTRLAEAARPRPGAPQPTPYGDGHAAGRVLTALSEHG